MTNISNLKLLSDHVPCFVYFWSRKLRPRISWWIPLQVFHIFPYFSIFFETRFPEHQKIVLEIWGERAPVNFMFSFWGVCFGWTTTLPGCHWQMKVWGGIPDPKNRMSSWWWLWAGENPRENPFVRGTTRSLRDLLSVVINHPLTGMILQGMLEFSWIFLHFLEEIRPIFSSRGFPSLQHACLKRKERRWKRRRKPMGFLLTENMRLWKVTLLKFNSEFTPEKWWLEDDPIGFR